MTTPPLALPRLPHEVIFAIGGWSEGMPQKFIETYDTRADRWVRMFNEDIAGPRAYHGTAVIGSKIFCIGGFDGMEYFNTCRCFDAIKKTWKEVIIGKHFSVIFYLLGTFRLLQCITSVAMLV